MTDFQGLDRAIVTAFEETFPAPSDPGVREEARALEALFGAPMPPEIGRVLELERHPVLAPTPRDLVTMERPFEALILRAQELDDCVSLLFPLTGSVYLRSFRGMDLLGHVTGAPDVPVMPFVGWRREKWAYDLPSLLQLAKAIDAFDAREDDRLEELLRPVWRRVRSTEWTAELFDVLQSSGAQQRLEDATADQVDHRAALSQWWRHERALFFGFAMMGKFREPTKGAFDWDPFPILERAHFTRDLGLQMGMLWRGWFVPHEDLLERAMAATAASTSLLVQDARKLIAELQDGREVVGGIDFALARRTYARWIEDPTARVRDQRRERRGELERRIEPSADGLEVVRAEWPLHGEAAVAAALPAMAMQWDAATRVLQIGDAPPRTLAEPDPAAKIYLATYEPKIAISPDGARFYSNGSVHRRTADQRSWENVPVVVEHDLESGTWRQLFDAAGLEWFACIDEGRWLRRDGQDLTLLRDLGAEMDGGESTFLGQPRTLHLPELGVVIAYGSADLANGRDPDDAGSPWLRVIAYWRERMECIAAFPIDAVEIVAEKSGGSWKIGFVGCEREVAWELRGLEAGAAAWRTASQREDAEERAEREAFGEITIDRAVLALNTFCGTDYGPEVQEGVNEAFAVALAVLRADADAVAAAKAAEGPLEIAAIVRNAFAAALNDGTRGPVFTEFALHCTILVPAYADIVVRAATTSAFAALRA